MTARKKSARVVRRAPKVLKASMVEAPPAAPSPGDWASSVVAGKPPLLTAKEAQELLRTTRRNLYRMAEAGKITTVKHGESGGRGKGGSSRLLIVTASIEKHLRSLEVAL
jgi:hypothetical protein